MTFLEIDMNEATIEHRETVHYMRTLGDTGFIPPDGTVDEMAGYHRHHNGGGWVANTAYVSYYAFVGFHARVSGLAWVGSGAKLLDHVHVSGCAIVSSGVAYLHKHNQRVVLRATLKFLGIPNSDVYNHFAPRALARSRCFLIGSV